MSARCSRVVFIGITAIAAFAPLAFGAVQVWARIAIVTIVTLLALVWLVDACIRGSLRLRTTWLYLPPAAFLCWGASQLVLDRALDRHAAREEMFWALGLALAWLLVLNACRQEELRRLAVFFAVFGFLLAMFAILQGLASPHDTIYWWQQLSQGPTAYGPFVNKNHYAGYMELLAPLPVALALFGGVRREQCPLFVFMGLVMAVSVALSLSRAGAIVVGLQSAALLSLSARARTGARAVRRFAAVAALLAVIAGAGAVWLGGEQLRDRFSTFLRLPAETSLAVRLQVNRDALAMIRERPIRGAGLGSFAAAYPRFKSFDDNLVWDHAHNDLLQLAVETGLVGTACVLLFLFGFRRLWQSAIDPDETDPFRKAVTAGIVTGCGGLLLHSLMDFHFRIPAIALTFVILYALGLALSARSAGGQARFGQARARLGQNEPG